MGILRFRYTDSCHLRNFGPCLSQFQFARIHTGSLVNIEIISNGPITKFYNSDDVKSRLTQSHGSLKGSQLFFIRDNLLQETISADENKVLKTKC